MSWFLIYATIAIAVLPVLVACCARGLREDPRRLFALLAAAALWPMVVVGVVQFVAIQLYTTSVRGVPAATGRSEQSPLEPEPVTAPLALLDSLARMAQQVGTQHPA